MPFKTFLETYPLYRKFKIDFGTITNQSFTQMKPGPIVRLCSGKCRSSQTFLCTGLSPVQFRNDGPPTMCYVYSCAACHEGHIEFIVDFDPARKWMRKVGQKPAWTIDVSAAMKKALGDDEELFKNGLVCESQSYGIGAYAYYRRVCELVTERLLTDLRPHLQGDALTKLDAALKSKRAEDRLKIAKDLLPPQLRPGGMNPLGIVYDTVSDHIHNGSDEECLERAEAVRGALTFLIESLEHQRAEMDRFEKSVQKLGKKRAS